MLFKFINTPSADIRHMIKNTRDTRSFPFYFTTIHSPIMLSFTKALKPITQLINSNSVALFGCQTKFVNSYRQTSNLLQALSKTPIPSGGIVSK
jgi:hypothetical protein